MKLNDWKILRCCKCGCQEIIYAPFYTLDMVEMDKEELKRDYNVTSASVVYNGGKNEYLLGKTCECGCEMKQVNVDEWEPKAAAEIISNILEDNNRHSMTGLPHDIERAMEDTGCSEKQRTSVLLKMAESLSML